MDGDNCSKLGKANAGPGHRTTRRRALVTASAAAAFLGVSGQVGAHEASTPVLDDPVAQATELMRNFAQVTMDKDIEGLSSLLADNFVIQRVVGPAIGKAAYLDALPDISGFEILSVDAWQTENVLMASSSVQMDLVVGDGTQLTPDPSPYLTTFIYLDGDWRVLAHANFGQIIEMDEA